jgi:hypothetical protein
MNGDLALKFSLTAYGNALLADRKTRSFWPDNSICKVCQRIDFVWPKTSRAKAATRDVTADPEQWFARLKKEGVQRIIWAGVEGNSDRNLSAFAGDAGLWKMATVAADGGLVYWLGDWKYQNKNTVANRVWAVTFKGVAARGGAPTMPPDLEKATAELHETLVDVRAFARSERLTFYGKIFTRALALLEGKKPVRMGDLTPPRLLSAPARRLTMACAVAWVFGGMGSWNDMMFLTDQAVQRYNQVSDRLFETVSQAIASAANASAPDR